MKEDGNSLCPSSSSSASTFHSKTQSALDFIKCPQYLLVGDGSGRQTPAQCPWYRSIFLEGEGDSIIKLIVEHDYEIEWAMERQSFNVEWKMEVSWRLLTCHDDASMGPYSFVRSHLHTCRWSSLAEIDGSVSQSTTISQLYSG